MSNTIERATCPHCESTELGEVNTLVGIASCTSITREPGKEPDIEYAGGTDVDWDNQAPNGQFQCEDCEAQFAEQEIVWVAAENDEDEDDDEDDDDTRDGESRMVDMLLVGYVSIGVSQALKAAGSKADEALEAAQGQARFMESIISHAKMLDDKAMAVKDSIAGNFYYEVAEPFGEAVAKAAIEGQPLDAGALADQLLASIMAPADAYPY